MAWIKSQQALREHPKLKRLARRLEVSVPAALGHLHMLWWWALDYAQDGDLTPFDPLDIADAAGWEGDPEAFIEAMVSCGIRGAGFLERTEDGDLLIHDWNEHCGDEFERRNKEAERLRAYREKKKKTSTKNVRTPDKMGAYNVRTPYETSTPDVRTPDEPGTYMVRGEEKRREEKRGTTPPISSPRGDEAVAPETSQEPPEDGAVKVAEVVELWNAELCPLGFPRVSKVTPDRRKHFTARLRDGAERRELAWWRDRIAAIAGSEFMRKNAAEKAPWLTFDWFLNETNLVKVTEGKYSHDLHLPRGQPHGQVGQSMDEYLRELRQDPFWGGQGGDETCSSETRPSSQPA